MNTQELDSKIANLRAKLNAKASSPDKANADLSAIENRINRLSKKKAELLEGGLVQSVKSLGGQGKAKPKHQGKPKRQGTAKPKHQGKAKRQGQGKAKRQGQGKVKRKGNPKHNGQGKAKRQAQPKRNGQGKVKRKGNPKHNGQGKAKRQAQPKHNGQGKAKRRVVADVPVFQSPGVEENQVVAAVEGTPKA